MEKKITGTLSRLESFAAAALPIAIANLYRPALDHAGELGGAGVAQPRVEAVAVEVVVDHGRLRRSAAAAPRHRPPVGAAAAASAVHPGAHGGRRGSEQRGRRQSAGLGWLQFYSLFAGQNRPH